MQSLEGTNAIIAGDFNCYRRATSCRDWNINNLNCGLSFKVHTPSIGQSIYEERAIQSDYEFAEDHFMTSGYCRIQHCSYNRSFMDNYPEIYTHGREFCLYDRESDEVIWRIRCGSGYPDHAILLGEMEFEHESSDTYVCSKCGREFEVNNYSIPPYCDECGDFD